MLIRESGVPNKPRKQFARAVIVDATNPPGALVSDRREAVFARFEQDRGLARSRGCRCLAQVTLPGAPATACR